MSYDIQCTMSNAQGGSPQLAGPSALPLKPDDSVLESVASALRGHDGLQQRGAKILATFPPHDPLDLDPPLLSDADLQKIRDVLAGRPPLV